MNQIIGILLLFISFSSYAQKHKWKHMGPSEQTIPLHKGVSPHGIGKVMCLEPIRKRKIYLGTNTSGLWMTRNKGKTWKYRLKFPYITGVNDIAIHPKKKRLLFIASAYHTSFSKQYGFGILKSKNGGRTWDTTGLNFTPQEYKQVVMRRVVVHPEFTNILFACSRTKIFKSMDLGHKWDLVYEREGADFRDLEINPFDTKEIHVLGRVWLQSKDLGSNWDEITWKIESQKLAPAYTRIELDFSRDQAGLIAIAYKRDRNIGIGISVDGGDAMHYFKRSIAYGAGIGKPKMAMQFVKESKELIVAGVRVVRIKDLVTGDYEKMGSRDGSSNQFIHDDIRELQYYRNELYAANDGGIAKWDFEKNEWRHLTGKGLKITQFYGVTNSNILPYFIAGGTQDMAAQLYKNNKWYNTTNLYGDIGSMVHHADSVKWLWAVRNSRVFMSKDTGFTWRPDHPGGRGRYDAPLKQIENKLFFGNSNFWEKDLVTSRWTNLTSGLKLNRPILSFTVLPKEKVMYLTIEEPTYNSNNLKGKLYKSMNNGASWKDITPNLPILAWREITDITTDKEDSKKVWVTLGNFDAQNGSSHKVYSSIDGGKIWKNESYNLPNFPMNCIYLKDSTIFLGSDVGLFYKKVNEDKWQRYGKGLPDVCISQIVYNDKINTLRVATFAMGIWEIEYK